MCPVPRPCPNVSGHTVPRAPTYREGHGHTPEFPFDRAPRKGVHL